MVASFTAAIFTPLSAGTDRVVSGVEFLVLLVELVALRFECRIYSYGALDNDPESARLDPQGSPGGHPA